MDSNAIAGQWHRVSAGLRDPMSWRSLGYVLASTLAAVGWFIVALVLLAPSLVLCVAGVGFGLTVAALGAVNRLMGFERRRAAWMRVPVEGRSLTPGTVMARFRDPDRWRPAQFALTAWLPALIAFTATAVVWGAPLYLLSIPLWGWAIDSFSTAEIVGQAVAGFALLFVAPHATQGIAQLYARFVQDRLGLNRLAMMEREVAEVTENRDEILTAVAGERRRIERNLHDGVQQQLVALGIDIGLAESKIDEDPEAARALLADASSKTRASIGELRAIGRGLHPAILGDRGLDAALSAAVANSSVPVELRADLPVNPPGPLGEAAYFAVSEALTNIMKHSEANLAVIEVISTRAGLELSIYDDGRGGADMSGTGLAGIAARVRGLNGTFAVSSPKGGPTTLDVTLPFA